MRLALLVLVAASLATPAQAGPATGPTGGVGVSYNCDASNDSSFTAGEGRATDSIAFVFPAGGGNLARTKLGYTVAISRTLVNLDTVISLPEATVAEDCFVGGSLSLTEPIAFTGNISATSPVQLEAILENWIIEVPDTAPTDADARFSFDLNLDTASAAESFIVTPDLGVVPSIDPSAWTISPLGGGRFSVSGGISVTATLATASPPAITLVADSFAFVPGGTTGITLTNTIAQAFRFEVVSLQPGVTVLALGVEPPAAQTKPQQKCLAALNAAAAKVLQAQTRLNEKCLKDATRGKEASAAGCAAADPQDKVGKASLKVMNADQQKCLKDPEQLPSFSYVSSNGLYVDAMAEGLAFLQDLLGADPDLAIRSDAREIQCQSTVLKLSDKHIDAILAEAIKAKKAALKGGAGDAEELRTAIEAALGGAAKLLKAESKLQQGAEKKCGEVADLGPVFPGAVSVGVSPSAVAEHAIEKGRCRACRALNAFDALFIDCDTFDDGLGNGSCP